MKVRGEWQKFVKHNYLDFILNPDDRLGAGACRARNSQGKRLRTFPFISFLGELSCVDGI